jgi:predicted Zn-dependent peptidase
VFENDSVTNIGHQLGYFETVANLDLYQDAPGRIAGVTASEVDQAARKYLRSDRRTVGWFTPSGGDAE